MSIFSNGVKLGRFNQSVIKLLQLVGSQFGKLGSGQANWSETGSSSRVDYSDQKQIERRGLVDSELGFWVARACAQLCSVCTGLAIALSAMWQAGLEVWLVI